MLGVGAHPRPLVRSASKQPKPIAVVVLREAGAVTTHERIVAAYGHAAEHVQRMPAVAHEGRDFIHAGAIGIAADRLPFRVANPS